MPNERNENSSTSSTTDGERTGYRKPPRHSRFKKSGNPKGRPRGAKNRKTILKLIANEKHSVRLNGTHQERSTLDIVLIVLKRLALKDNNVRAFNELHRLMKTYDPEIRNETNFCLVVPETLSPAEWEEAERKRMIEVEKQRANWRRLEDTLK